MFNKEPLGVICGLKLAFRYTAHGRLFGLKVTGPKVRKPTELPPKGGILKDPVPYLILSYLRIL